MNASLRRPGATKEARRIVLAVIGAQSKPPTVQEIFKLAVQHEASHEPSSSPSSMEATTPSFDRKPQPRYPDHEIKSMRYLKTVVLPSLLQTKNVQKVHSAEELTPEQLEQRLQTMTRSSRKQAASLSTTVDVWRWQLRTYKYSPPKPKTESVYGTEVGVGADWSHLNKRRQRSRSMSIARDVGWLEELDKAREEGRKAADEIAS
ncbi:uncharacterized protein FIBRA_07572 [Fibroporia radiculosa]|uniref:Uncharacterized protein n=1 Tax=Fibroporia radiculosa TaxID=599839 RepID=J4GEY1_9APHY|nr:uncharacterized protein FIBRA_07572 [Fibroporia radiculosa]CCM05358.1 predicted protein [Fibroporia radiculosa]